MEERRVLLVAAGELPDGEWLERFIGPERTVIAVDGGLAHLRAVSHAPDLVVGDLDSASEGDLEWARAGGAEVVRLRGQEESDLAKAFALCSERGWSLIEVVGVAGGRADHQFATFASLAAADNSLSITTHLETGVARRFTTGGEESFNPEGEFSLFALKRAKVTLSGAKYELGEEWLELDTRGLSNHSDREVKVELHEGGPILLFLNS
jgi:thiamine pyrophosphokinase